MCGVQCHLHVHQALRLQGTWVMITFAARTREMRPPGSGCGETGALVVAVVRTEDAIVSHDRLLTASGHREDHTTGALSLPLGCTEIAGVGDVTARELGDQPSAVCGLGAEAESARQAREFTRVTLQDWGMTGRCDVAELVVSELVTNSLRHGLHSARWMPGEHPIGLTILRRDPYLICMVTDPGSKRPVRMESGAGAEGGRGLQVVESCSVQWGWQPVAGDGKLVWALLRLADLRRLQAGRAGDLPASCPRLPRTTLRRPGRRTRRPWRHG
jgi:anti-sigma regulatory factor (Ser/Thr protein kinase)